jgi:hypothetical protein
MKKKLLLALLSLTAWGSKAQTTPFPTIEYLDVNRFNTGHLVHGDMWWNPATNQPSCEYPKGTGKHASFAGAIWMSGVDDAGALHVAAQTYRQKGNDYWPGPLDATDTITYPTSQNWAKIWKINRSDVVSFLSSSTHTLASTPTVILEWPGKGSAYAKGNAGASLSITTEMAPFVDVDGDGVYNPLKGDYPDMKGDQMLWWVFNDNGSPHGNSGAQPLKIECHAMAYGYSRGGAVDNMMFYEYTLYNKSSNKYSGFRFGFWSDADLGNPSDDYIGFDSTHRMAIEYNATLPDGANGLNSYGTHPPITGLSFTEMPGDGCAGAMPAGSFDYFENASSPIFRDPDNATSFDNYMHAKTYNGLHILKSYPLKGLSYPGNYVFPGTEMCDSSFMLADRRYVMATNDYTFLPNSKTKVGMVFMATDTTGNACGHLDINAITKLADSAWKIYCTPLPLGTHDISLAQNTLKVYPNPAQTILFIETKLTSNEEQVLVYDALGRVMNIGYNRKGATLELNISALAPGVYSLLYRNGTAQQSQTFVKQ